MTISLADVEAQARMLSAEDRARLAEMLLDSLDAADSGQHAAAWDREVAARVAAYEVGEVKTHAAEDVLAEAFRLAQ